MKKVKFNFILTLIVFCSCNNKNISGIYLCDQSQKQPDTTITKNDHSEYRFDLTCLIEELNFKGNSTVEVRMRNGSIITSYIIDKEYVRVKGSQGDLLFKIEDCETLIAEGNFKGIYNKK